MIHRMRDKPLDARNGHRTLRGHLPSKRERSREDLLAGARHDARHEPEPSARLVGAKRASRERELEEQRRVGAGSAGGRTRERAHVRREADVHLLDAELGVGRRPAHVDGAEQVDR